LVSLFESKKQREPGTVIRIGRVKILAKNGIKFHIAKNLALKQRSSERDEGDGRPARNFATRMDGPVQNDDSCKSSRKMESKVGLGA
jgi:hypothetical protein